MEITDAWHMGRRYFTRKSMYKLLDSELQLVAEA